MDNRFQPGQHPDADQLSAFMEMALPEHERLETLAHLAECEDCRTIVFLAQKDLLPEAQVTVEPELQPWWKGIWHPVPIAALAFACLFLVVASVGVHQILNNSSKPTHEAKNLPAAPVQNRPAEAQPKPQTVEPQKSEKAVRKPVQEPSSPAPKEISKASTPERFASPSAVSAAPASGQGVAGGVMGGIGTAPTAAVGKSPMSPAAAAAPQAFTLRKRAVEPAPDVAASALDATTSSVAQLPVNGRNLTSLPVTEGPLRLTIEHGRGTHDGLSELRGTVRDASGAVIPKASISLHGLSVQANASTASDNAGVFAIPSLPAGQYEIQVASMGFQSLTQRVDLQPRDLAQINPVLPIGSMSETVSVTAEARLLQTESAQVVSTNPKSPEGSFGSQMALNGTALGFDAQGTLFRREAGKKSWKKVKPKWHGVVVQLSLDPGTKTADQVASTGLPSFQIATSTGEAWSSPDGRHWTRR
jgi:hypothetical protein